jgi:hypothetical protein
MLFTHQVQYSAESERTGITPAQFLPSMMLSWRAPIMARDQRPEAGRKLPNVIPPFREEPGQPAA